MLKNLKEIRKECEGKGDADVLEFARMHEKNTEIGFKILPGNQRILKPIMVRKNPV